MATSWKRVLTDADLGSLSGDNLGNADLTQADATRVYDMGTNPSLQFRHTYLSAYLPAFEIFQTGGSPSVHQLYLGDAGAQGGVFVGMKDVGSKYKLPLSNSCSQGKILSGDSASVSAFNTIETLLNPTDGTAYSYGSFNNFSVSSSSDKLLVFDTSANKFGIRTIDDVVGGVDDNLASSDLTQGDTDRSYFLPESTGGSALRFAGTVDGTVENMIQVECDSNSASNLNSYVHLKNPRIGTLGNSGNPGVSGYGLPPQSNSVGAGEILVTNNFSSDEGEMTFKTFGEVLDPATGDGLYSTSYLSAGSVSYDDDSYLIYDQTGSGGLRHIRPYELRAPQLFHFGSTASGQTVTMRGVNGVQHNVTSNGVTIPKAMTLASLSFSLKKTDNGTGTAKFEIWRNGSKYMETTSQLNGAETTLNEWAHGNTHFNGNGYQSPKIFGEGDWVAVRIVKTGTCGTGAHQVTLRFV
jgi:hypothetical protein